MSATKPGGMFRPLRHAPAYRALSAELERMILTGQLKPDEPLPTETELAVRFCVNRSTVREAIRLLEQDGLVCRAAGRRLKVAVPGLFDLAPRATRALMLQQVSFLELWEVAMTLEPLAARLATDRICADTLARLDTILDETAVLLARGGSAALCDQRFHALVARASGNRVLMLAREPVSLLYAPALEQLEQLLPQADARNLEAHRRIVAALRSGDADEAERWTRKHLIDFQRGFEHAGLRLDAAIQWPAESMHSNHPHEETLT